MVISIDKVLKIVSNKFKDTLNYLILENIINTEDLNLNYIFNYISDTDIVEYILKSKKINMYDLHDTFIRYLRNSKIMKIFMGYHFIDKEGNEVKLDNKYLLSTFDHARIRVKIYNTYVLSLETFKMWYNFISKGRYTTRSLLNQLYKFVHIPDNIKFYILEELDKSNPNREDIVNSIILYPNRYKPDLKLLIFMWYKYKNLFTSGDILALKNSISSSDDSDIGIEDKIVLFNEIK
jgi:hypothetical protein